MKLLRICGVWLTAMLVFLTVPTIGQTARHNEKKTTEAHPTILFVCEHGAAKSLIAATYFDKLAREKKLKYQAIFRGTNPDPELALGVVQGLKDDGFSVSGKPQLIDKKVMDEAAQIITLGCTVPNAEAVSSKLTDWNAIPAPRDYQAARDAIKRKVEALVNELAKKQ